MNENERIDQAAQDQEDSDSMIDSVNNRLLAAMYEGVPNRLEQPKVTEPNVTDFTRIVRPSADVFSDKLDYVLQVGVDGRWITVGHHPSLDTAMEAELAITQILIEYRTKRNRWEKEWIKSRIRVPRHDLVGHDLDCYGGQNCECGLT